MTAPAPCQSSVRVAAPLSPCCSPGGWEGATFGLPPWSVFPSSLNNSKIPEPSTGLTQAGDSGNGKCVTAEWRRLEALPPDPALSVSYSEVGQNRLRVKGLRAECNSKGPHCCASATPPPEGQRSGSHSTAAHLDEGISHIQRLLPAEWGGHSLSTGDEGAAGQAAHQVWGIHLVQTHLVITLTPMGLSLPLSTTGLCPFPTWPGSNQQTVSSPRIPFPWLRAIFRPSRYLPGRIPLSDCSLHLLQLFPAYLESPD